MIYNASSEALSHRRDTSMLLELSRAPGLATLNQIEGIDHVDSLEKNRFRIFLKSEASVEPLVKASVEQDWGLQQLTPEQQSLEDLFIELTAAEEEPET